MTTEPFKIRLRPWIIVLANLITPLHLLATGFGGLIIYEGIYMLRGAYEPGVAPTGAPVPGHILLILIPILFIIPFGLFFALAQLYLAALKVGTAVFSYVIILPDGLEVDFWPQFHVFCAWGNIERETSAPFQGPTKQMLRMPSAQTLPEHYLAAWLRPPRHILPFLPNSVIRFSPNSFQGYPNGVLEAALRQHAPQLFASSQDQPVSIRD